MCFANMMVSRLASCCSWPCAGSQWTIHSIPFFAVLHAAVHHPLMMTGPILPIQPPPHAQVRAIAWGLLPAAEITGFHVGGAMLPSPSPSTYGGAGGVSSPPVYGPPPPLPPGSLGTYFPITTGGGHKHHKPSPPPPPTPTASPPPALSTFD